MRAIITIAIMLCPELPLLGLHQSIHNLTIPLRLKDILDAPSISSKDGRIGVNITQSLISDLIKRIYTASVNTIFRGSDYYLKMLNIYCLTVNKTKF